MKRVALAVLLLAAVGTAAFLYFRTRRPAATGAVRVSGNIEVTEAEVSFKIPGRVLERRVDEGDEVKLGQEVARLDATDLEQEVSLGKARVRAAEAALAELLAGARPEEVAEAEAAVRQARFRLAELLAGSRPQEVAAAEAAVASAKAEADRWDAEHVRQKNLYERDVISTREYEAARASDENARARLRDARERLDLVREGPRKEAIGQARAALSRARERLSLVRKGPREETIEQARARLQQEREALALAGTRLGYARTASPLTGVVLSKNVEPGEYVAPGTPVVTVGDLRNVWLRAYVDETDLGRVKVGQRVEVTADTYPGRVYHGRVSFLASQAEFTPKAVQTRKERVKLVYRVKVDIRNPELELKPGMPADALIETGANDNR